MVRIIILLLFLGTPYAAPQINSDRDLVDIDSIKQMIDKAGWLYRDGDFSKSAVEVRRAQRYLEKLVRETTGPLDSEVELQHKRLAKAHRLLRTKGADLVDLKPLPDPKARLAAAAARQAELDNRSDPGNTRGGDPFKSSGSTSVTKDRSADPFAGAAGIGSKSGNQSSSSSSSSSGDPFADPKGDSFAQGDSKSADQSGDSLSGSGDSSAGRSGDPFADPKGNPFAQGGSKSADQSGDSSSGSGRSGDPFADPKDNPFAQGDSKGAGETEAASDEPKISFTKEIAPILMSRCGRCHVRQARGEFSMANYRALIDADSVIAPDQPDDSLMIQMIKDGEMPPQGSVPAQELKKLQDWIAEGAEFDGDDESENLSSFSGNRRGR